MRYTYIALDFEIVYIEVFFLTRAENTHQVGHVSEFVKSKTKFGIF